MRTKNEDLELSGTDMTSNIDSKALWLGHIVNYSIQVVYTGSPNGTLSIEASNDEGSNTNDTSNAQITNWTQVDAQAVSAAGSHMFQFENVGYKWVRLVWTNSSSGASTITSARYNIKGI